MSNPWFRMYVDFLDDPKMISLAFEDQRHYIGLLALKCSGVLDQSAKAGTLGRVIAQRLWIDHAVISDVKKRLIASGLIDSEWQPVAWSKRQRKSDIDSTVAQRQQRFRESNALRNGTVTDTDKNRIEKNREENPIPDWLPKSVFDDFKQHRKKLKKPLSEKAESLFIRELTKIKDKGHDPVECVERAILNGWLTVYEPKGQATFKQKDEFTDE